MKRRPVGMGTNQEGDFIPVWSPRVKMGRIRRLYETDAKGVRNEELLDEVGTALLCRCESFIAANEVRAGKPLCPACGEVAVKQEGEEPVLRCECGWELSHEAYFKTIQHKQLSGGENVIELFREFIHEFSRARNPRRKMVLIDQLIHGFHGALESIGAEEQGVRRPAGVNLIEGNMHDVIRFLNDLTYGAGSTPELQESRKMWELGLKANPEG